MKTLKSSTKKGRTARMVTAVVLCLALMIGATYAWFSDSASTGINTITAGNLKVMLKYKDMSVKPNGQWKDATDHNIFDDKMMTNWEPGMVVYSESIRVENAGTLNLKYQFTINVNKEEKTSTGKSLSDVIKAAVLKETDFDNITGYTTEDEHRTAIIEYVKNNGGFQPISTFEQTGRLAPPAGDNDGITKEQIVILYWEPNTFEVDNLYNNKGGEISFGLHVNATQDPKESDSFGSNYDADIAFPTSAPVNP